MLVLGAFLALFLAGCSSSEERAYRDKIIDIQKRIAVAEEKAEAEAQQFEAQMQNIANSIDESNANAMLGTFVATIAAYSPKIQAYIGQVQGFSAEIGAVTPPPKYVNEHKMYVNGLSIYTVSLQQLVEALTQLMTLTNLQAAETRVQDALRYQQQAAESMKKADDYLFTRNWTVVFLIGATVVAILTALGYWTAVVGRNNGRDFEAYYCLGFFLGPLGVAIAYLTTRRGPPARQPAPAAAGPYRGYYPQAPPPGQGGYAGQVNYGANDGSYGTAPQWSPDPGAPTGYGYDPAHTGPAAPPWDQGGYGAAPPGQAASDQGGYGAAPQGQAAWGEAPPGPIDFCPNCGIAITRAGLESCRGCGAPLR